MKLYSNKKSLYDKEKAKSKMLSLALAFSVFVGSANVLNLSNCVFQKSNPFDGQSISSSDFISNYKASKSMSFIKDENFKDAINSIKNSGMDQKKAYLLYYALLSNDYLTAEEKKNLSGYIQYFIDNKYLDYEYVYFKLSWLGIDPNDISLLDDSIAGTYTRESNTITFADEDNRDYAISHEIFHAEDKTVNNGNNTWFTEGLTDLLSYEYNNSKISYDVEVNFCRILCEFVGADVLFETRAKGDINILINALINKGLEKNEVDELFKLINDYRWERKKENPDFNSIKIGLLTELQFACLKIFENQDYISPMLYQHILYIYQLDSQSSKKYYFNSNKVNEIPTVISSTIEYSKENEPNEVIKEEIEKEYHSNYILEIKKVNGTAKFIKRKTISKNDFILNINSMINELSLETSKDKSK